MNSIRNRFPCPARGTPNAAGLERSVPGLALVLLTATLATSPALAVSPGQALFQNKGCAGCHNVGAPLRFRDIASRHAKMKAPQLWFAGSKFQTAWLQTWLASPTPIRGLQWGGIDSAFSGWKHPRVSGSDATSIIQYLTALKDPRIASSGPAQAKAPNKSRLRQGRRLFEAKGACYGCHRYPKRSKITGGWSGARLWDAGRRLKPEWIKAYLKSPDTYDPMGRMPRFGTQFTAAEYDTLADYLGSFQLTADTGRPPSARDTGSGFAGSDKSLDRTFRWYCAQCHGRDGKGKGPNATADLPTQPMNLTDPKQIGRFTDENTTNTLTRGGPASGLSVIMPGFGNTLSRKDIAALTQLIRKRGGPYDPSLAGKQPPR